MEAYHMLPDPRLRSFIDFYRYTVQDLTCIKASKTHLCVPISKRLIAIYLNGSVSVTDGNNNITHTQEAVVVGQHFKPVHLNHSLCPRMLCIVFKTTGLFRLLKMDLQELDNQCVSFFDIFGNEAKELTCRLENVNSMEELKREADVFFLKHISSAGAALRLDELLSTMTPNQTISELAGTANMCIRQFQRICRQRLGMSPKQYLRLKRFCQAYEMKEKYTFRTWTDIAYACDYYDQMHLIRDWRLFTDTLPASMESEIMDVAHLRNFNY